MKRMIGWIWWRAWFALYGKWTGWARSIHFDRPIPIHWNVTEWSIDGYDKAAVVGYSAIRSGEKLRWFWRRNVAGIETLGKD